MEATRDVESGAERALDRISYTSTTFRGGHVSTPSASFRANSTQSFSSRGAVQPASISSRSAQVAREPVRLLAIADGASGSTDSKSWQPPWWVLALGVAALLLVTACALLWLKWSSLGNLAGSGEAHAAETASKQPFQQLGGPTVAQGCCDKPIAKCLACKAGWSIEEFCSGQENMQVEGCEGKRKKEHCCSEDRAECFACEAKLPLDEYCAKTHHFGVIGCEGQPERRGHHRSCCGGVTAECLACRDGMTPREYCSKPENARVSGCEGGAAPEPAALDATKTTAATTTTVTTTLCCTDRAAKCLACKGGLSVGEYCIDQEHSQVPGCESYCGMMEDNYVYPGGNIFDVENVESASDCCAKCRAMKNCSSWSWGKKPGSTYHKSCYLKNQIEFIRHKDELFVSGLPGRNVMTFQIKNRHGLCLDWSEHLHLAPCRGSSKQSQQWYIDRRAGVLGTRHGLCIDSVEYLNQGGGIHLQPCLVNAPSQFWTFDGISGLIRHVRGFCMDAPNYAEEGSEIRMWPCSEHSPTQLWSLWNTQVLGQSATLQAMELEAMTSSTTTTATTSTSTVTTTTPKIGPAESLYCWSLMLPWGYEHHLLHLQYSRSRGIFGCDEADIYSSEVINISGNDSSYVQTRVVNYDLHCKIGGQFMTALNTPIFVHVWQKVLEDGRYRHHAWTVKADPDAVFFPERLRNVIAREERAQTAQAGNGMFLNNCGFGLHGPLEVVSRRALDTYSDGWRSCRRPPQEDVYLQACMLRLRVKQVDCFELLAEEHCKSTTWKLCQSHHVAFHPFKTMDAYSGCLENADRFDESGGRPGMNIIHA